MPVSTTKHVEATMTLKAGTIVHVGGIPVELASDVDVHTHPGNVALIEQAIAEQKVPRGTSESGTATVGAG